MADNMFELPPTPPTPPSGPAIDPSSPWHPHFELPSAAPAGRPANTAPAGARRAAATNRTRVIVGGASVASFLAILAAVGLHGGSQPASNLNTTSGDSPASFDPGFVRPDFGQFPGGFSATPGSGSGSPNTRSHGS